MTKRYKIIPAVLLLLNCTLFIQCGIYSFTGASIPAGTETFQVNYFINEAGNRPGSTVEPGLDQEFTIALQDLILNQTNLNLVKVNGDLVYEGEITKYSITPTTSTANNTAAQNRLSMEVNLRYTNTKNEDDYIGMRNARKKGKYRDSRSEGKNVQAPVSPNLSGFLPSFLPPPPPCSSKPSLHVRCADTSAGGRSLDE